MSTQALPSIDTVEDVFNVLDTEITALAEYLDPSFCMIEGAVIRPLDSVLAAIDIDVHCAVNGMSQKGLASFC